MSEKDYIAMWYNARRRFGIDDKCLYGWYNPQDESVDWKFWRHSEADGMAGMAKVMRELGFPSIPLPTAKETKEPGWKEILTARKNYTPPKSEKKVNWRKTYEYSPGDENLPEVDVIHAEDFNAIKLYAKNNKLSYGNVVYSALSRVVAKELINGSDPFYWFFPINVRGAVDIKTESFNQATGIYLLINPEDSAHVWQEQMRGRLKAKEQWLNWKLGNLGKLVGEDVLAWIYKQSSKKMFYVGNCSHLGSWPLPHSDNPDRPYPERVLIAIAPGTANYPISSTLIEWYDDLVLALKIHPFICQDQAMIKRILSAWRDEILLSIQ